jgi:hypothetical protein
MNIVETNFPKIKVKLQKNDNVTIDKLTICIEKNVIIVKLYDIDGTYRQFTRPVPNTISMFKPGSVDIKQTLSYSIIYKQCWFKITPIGCSVVVPFYINQKPQTYNIHLPEVFDINIVVEHIPEEFKQIFANMRNKINNLEYRNEELKSTIKELKDNSNLLYY